MSRLLQSLPLLSQFARQRVPDPDPVSDPMPSQEEDTPPPPPPPQAQAPETSLLDNSCLQDIDEWMKENPEDTPQARYAPKKKVKPAPPSGEALTAEQAAITEIGDGNWIGKLMEYRQANPVDSNIAYKETTLNPSGIARFVCSLNLHESPEDIPALPVSFSNKKTAKQYACKKAIDFLIANNHMPADGSVRFPKPPPPPQPSKKVKRPQPPSPSGSASGSASGGSSGGNNDSDSIPGLSYTTQIPMLCNRLGLTTPSYSLTPVLAGSPLWDCYADFGGSPIIEGRVGEVKSIHGKKNAKEECAKEVYSFLKSIERHRMGGLAESEEGEITEAGKRKRGAGSLGNESGTAVKVQA